VNKARFEAFSDGVFSIAITLLVLGFSLPAARLAGNRELTRALLDLFPNFVAYVLSFAVIGIMWQNHHALFRLVTRVDRATILWNLFLLGGTALIPFATSTLGTYPTLEASAVLYGLTITSTATAFNLLLAHLIRSKSFAPSVSEDTIRATVRAYRTGWVTYALATLLALAFPLLSIAAFMAVTIYYLIPRGADTDLDLPD
jgi:uncharacterized membrane protein